MDDDTATTDGDSTAGDPLDEIQRKLDVLVEGASRTEPEHDTLEIIATVLLGLAAVLIAWSVYQSSLWGGIQDTALTESVNNTTKSADSYQVADSTRALDQTLFIEVFTSGVCDDGGDEFACDQIFANMSPEGATAVEEWLDNDEFAPFDSESYNEVLYAEGNEYAALAEEDFADADEANKNGDKYELASTILTIALFFAGISIVLHWRGLRIATIVAAGGFLVGASIFLATLPVTS